MKRTKRTAKRVAVAIMAAALTMSNVQFRHMQREATAQQLKAQSQTKLRQLLPPKMKTSPRILKQMTLSHLKRGQPEKMQVDSRVVDSQAVVDSQVAGQEVLQKQQTQSKAIL